MDLLDADAVRKLLEEHDDAADQRRAWTDAQAWAHGHIGPAVALLDVKTTTMVDSWGEEEWEVVDEISAYDAHMDLIFCGNPRDYDDTGSYQTLLDPAYGPYDLRQPPPAPAPLPRFALVPADVPADPAALAPELAQ